MCLCTGAGTRSVAWAHVVALAEAEAFDAEGEERSCFKIEVLSSEAFACQGSGQPAYI